MRLLDTICGIAVFSVECEHAETLLDMLFRTKLVYRGFKLVGDRAELICSAHTARKLSRLCTDAEISFRINGERGLPYIGRELKNRLGLPIGIIAAIAVIILGESVIWDVRVVGCSDVLTETEVEELFAELGVRPGVFKRSLDVDRLSASAVTESTGLAWAAINIRGTTAVIEIVEQKDPDDMRKDDMLDGYDGQNLIAAEDGLIVELEVIGGKPEVSRGQVVKKGELLVSGVIDSDRQGVRLAFARGEVRAQLTRRLEVSIPYEYQMRVPNGESDTEFGLIFFSHDIKLFSRGEAIDTSVGVTERRELLTLPGGRVAPIGFTYRKRLGYTVESAKRSSEEAERLAEFELSRRISDMLSEGSYTVGREITRKAGENTYMLTCELTVIENIATPQGFTFEEISN